MPLAEARNPYSRLAAAQGVALTIRSIFKKLPLLYLGITPVHFYHLGRNLPRQLCLHAGLFTHTRHTPLYYGVVVLLMDYALGGFALS